MYRNFLSCIKVLLNWKINSFLVSGNTRETIPTTVKRKIIIPIVILINVAIILTENLIMLSFSTIITSSGTSYFFLSLSCLFSCSFSGLKRMDCVGLGMGYLWGWQSQKKKQDQTNFFEIHLTLLHVFYVLFHSDTWMSLSGTRTLIIQTRQVQKYS